MIKEITVIDKDEVRYTQYFNTECKEVESAAKELNITTEKIEIRPKLVLLYDTEDDDHIGEGAILDVLDYKEQYKIIKNGDITVIK